MKLGTLSTIDNIGATKMLAACLVATEDAESFQWVFECFLQAFKGVAPKVMFTDSDPAMKVAIEKILKDTRQRGNSFKNTQDITMGNPKEARSKGRPEQARKRNIVTKGPKRATKNAGNAKK